MPGEQQNTRRILQQEFAARLSTVSQKPSYHHVVWCAYQSTASKRPVYSTDPPHPQARKIKEQPTTTVPTRRWRRTEAFPERQTRGTGRLRIQTCESSTSIECGIGRVGPAHSWFRATNRGSRRSRPAVALLLHLILPVSLYLSLFLSLLGSCRGWIVLTEIIQYPSRPGT